jgi:hypothetical protein
MRAARSKVLSLFMVLMLMGPYLCCVRSAAAELAPRTVTDAHSCCDAGPAKPQSKSPHGSEGPCEACPLMHGNSAAINQPAPPDLSLHVALPAYFAELSIPISDVSPFGLTVSPRDADPPPCSDLFHQHCLLTL